MARARANAKLAMMLAIGDLQVSAGIDQRITAPGGVLGTATSQQMICGVWKSKKLGPSSTPDDFSKAAKTNEFVKWLVSGGDPTELKNESFATKSLGTGKDVIDLVSASYLDPGAPIVQARKVGINERGISSATPTGTYAYAVLDEGTKARINLGNNSPSTDFAGTSTALGSGQRPSLEGIKGIGTFDAKLVDLDTPEGRSLTTKMVSVPTSEFAYASGPGKMKFRFHDITTSSVGVLADVANGGLKKDLNLLAEMQLTDSLPAAYKGNGIYKQSFNSNIVSDPLWNRAMSWAGIFSTTALGKLTSGGTSAPTLNASVPLKPKEWTAGIGKSSGGGSNPASALLSYIEPPGPVLLPSIAKIQMSFSLAARDVYNYKAGGPIPKDAKGGNPLMHGPWDAMFQKNLNTAQTFDSPYDYLLHMIYSPIVTLHNPYNLPLNFTKLRVEFVNVPFAFQVFKNGIAQTKEPVPFALMYGVSVAGGQSKRFGLTLTDTLLPGEVKVYSPNIDPDRTWMAELQSPNKLFWDWGNRNDEDGRAGSGTATDTSKALGIPGWNGPSVGYDLDFIAPGTKQAYPTESVGAAKIERWSGIPLKKGDEIYVESTPIPDPALPEKKFSVEMTLNYSSGKKSRCSALVFEFGDKSDLQEVMMSKNPQADKLKIRAPKGTDTWTTDQLFDHSSVALKNIVNNQAFALFSAYAKTTSSGNSNNGEEGLWVAKPFSFQNHTSVAVSQKISKSANKGHPSHYSHELALARFPLLGIGVQGKTNRGKFITGHSSIQGRHFGTIYDIPLAPIQNLTSLNSAQLAASPYLPHFSAPVGNSYAHPLISSSKVIEVGAAGYDYADHSFLLSAALFDSYYFSGFQSHAASALDGDGVTRDNLVDQFMESSNPAKQTQSPLPDRRLKPYFPDGTNRTDASTALKGTEGYIKASAYQVVEGAFNVNSISVNAWRSVLASMTGENAMALVAPDSTSITTTLSKGNVEKMSDSKGARFSRLRIPNGQADRNSPDGFWRGPVDLSEKQLTELATQIVKQVRERGPFLSMAEFVNRQLGSAGEMTSAGALQTAIDKSGLNAQASAAAGASLQITAANTANLKLSNPEALVGDSAQGAPGYLMQADILAVLGNTASVRSDTFRIRTYGEALDKTGKIIARAYCEAVVQRNPEFLDPLDKASQSPAALTSSINTGFGRRFTVVSMRWLSKDEI